VQSHSKDALSRAAKIRPSVLILVSSRSKISIPSRRPFVHVMGNVCPFDTCVPLVGYVTRKSTEGIMRGGQKR
jgi:hypothetical protein